MLKSANGVQMFGDVARRKRYFYALLMILLMIGAAELLMEREIIFPEMAALTIGMWIVDKRVWRVSRIGVVVLMTLGAIAGGCIVRYSPFPLLANLMFAFAFAAICLTLSRATLVPQISACMLPVLLETESWVYPVAVFIMSVIVVGGQWGMERMGLREKITYTSVSVNWREALVRWAFLLMTVAAVVLLAVYTENLYFILPPLIVTYVEFANSKAGFRNRPVQVLLVLFTAAVVGVFFQVVGHGYLHLPEVVVVFPIFICMFFLFEFLEKFFAPAGAVALIPMIVPEGGLFWLPLQVLVGATLFIGLGMIWFQRCLHWPREQLIVCLVPPFIRGLRKRSL